MTKVDLITTRFGGPTNWAHALAKAAQSSPFDIRVHSRALRTLCSPFWSSADLVHTVLPIPVHTWSAPMLLTIKGDYRIEKRIWRTLYPLTIRQANRITVPSVFLQQALGLTNAIVIPNAIDVNAYNVNRTQTKEKLELLTVSKFWFKDKAEGVVRLAKNVATAMQSSGLPYHLTILGEGPYLSSVMRRVSTFAMPVTFTGAAAPKSYYQRASIFVYYSLHDNMPNAILEAMASGLPILSNDVGAVPEMIEHGIDGFVVTSDDEYISCLIQLAENNKLRNKLGAAARQKAQNDFSWNVILPKYLKIYKDLLV